MYDTFLTIGNSKIYHGKLNNRIYLMDLNKADYPSIIKKLNELSQKNSYTKIFAKVPDSCSKEFIKDGFEKEAVVKKMFDREDGIFLSKYLDDKRKNIINKDEIKKIHQIAQSKKNRIKNITLPNGFFFRKLGKTDVSDLAKLYKEVFISYPFPIYDKNYLTKTMKENIDYFGVFKGRKIIAAASAEKYETNKHAEMTDFATLPGYRGLSLGTFLLKKMEGYIKLHNYKVAYTISRATQTGINIIFSKLNYEYGGTLYNNTNIGGKLESMNVWFKTL